MPTISQEAIEQIKLAIQTRQKGLGVRFGVKKTGCSGFAYTVEFLDAIGVEDDVVYDDESVLVAVDKASGQYFAETKVDYKQDDFAEGFEFDNPKIKGKCGCGESFTI